MDGRILRRKRGGRINKRKLTLIYALSVAIGITLGIITLPHVITTEIPSESRVFEPLKPVAIDNEPTLNKHARQAFHASALSKRKAYVEARKKAVITVSRSAEPVVNEYRFVVTAYTAGYESTGKRPGDVGYGKTASGEYVKEGVTVACPKSLAFGTRLYIEGVGYRVCHDRGGDITQGRLDVYIADIGQAQAFGRQTLKVRILRKGND